MGGKKNRNKKKQQQNKKNKNANVSSKNRYGGHNKPHSQQNSIFDKLQTAHEITNNELRDAHHNNNHHNDYYNGGGRNNKKNKNRYNHQNNKRKNNKWKEKASYKSELNQFLDQLRPTGLGIRNARSDGNCLFRAIADQITGDENNQARFRNGIVQYMINNSEEFAPFYVGDYEAYLKKMSRNGEWGGNMELTAATKAFKVDIVIHSLNAARYELLYQKGGKPERTIHLSYHNERHYASVRRLDDMNSNRPARVINLDKTHTEKMAREQQRAEIAWCHNGGNPLDIESAKDELLHLSAEEQMVVARTQCFDIVKVKQALLYLEGNIDAAVESIMVDISLMANEHKEKTREELEKQKEEDKKEQSGDNNGQKGNGKKKNRHKRRNRRKNKGKNKEKMDKSAESEKKVEANGSEEKKEMSESTDVKSTVMNDDDLEQRLAEMKESSNGKKESSNKKNEKSLDDILSVKVKICHDTKPMTDMNSDLNKKNHSNIKESKEEKLNEKFDSQYYLDRDERINELRLKMKKIECIDSNCSFEHELLLIYLKHYRFVHMQGGVDKSLPNKKDIICVCGHRNQFDFNYCSQCQWDLRYKTDIPDTVKQSIQTEIKLRNSQKHKPKSQSHNIGRIPAQKLLKTGGKAIIIHKKQNKSHKSNKKSHQSNKKSAVNIRHKYRSYMHSYWACSQCSFVNPKTNLNCMVCSMLNGKATQYKNKPIKNQSNVKSESYPPLHNSKPSTATASANNWVSMAAQNKKPKPKPIKQKKKNKFAWICPKCTCENKPALQNCQACDNPKPKKGKTNKRRKPQNNSTNTNANAGVTSVYYADPQYEDYNEYDLKNEMDSYNTHKKNEYSANNAYESSEQSSNNGKWSNKGNGKCKCGSGKKYKKCCKKLEKHQDKSYKNKFKNAEYQHQSNCNSDPISELKRIIDTAEREICEFKGKKHIKSQMIKGLQEAKAKRRELIRKLESNKNMAIKAQNRRNKPNGNQTVYIGNGQSQQSGSSAVASTVIAI